MLDSVGGVIAMVEDVAVVIIVDVDADVDIKRGSNHKVSDKLLSAVGI